MKDLGEKKDDVLYQLPSGAWGSIAKDFKIKRDTILDVCVAYYKRRVIPATWVLNDFGPVAIRWFKDLNGNRILDGKEQISGQMFHTTPLNEAQHAQKQVVQLSPSHGCIHLKPADRDMLFAIGAFKPKTEFTIHKHNERY